MTLALGTVVRAFAPGSIGNVGPGFDILGLAVAGAGDTVVAEVVTGRGVRLADSGHPDLPSEPDAHTCAIAASEVLRRAGVSGTGVVLTVSKGLPLAGGQGGSAASAVAGAVAVNAMLDTPLPPATLIDAAMAAEERVSGRHADNIGPALFGGLVLVRSLSPLDVVRLPRAPRALRVVLVHPEQRLRTADARRVVPTTLARDDALRLAANVAGLITGFLTADYALIARSLDDRLAEPARAPLLPGFAEAKTAALDAGALGCSISGSGPTAFALTRGAAVATRVGVAMQRAYAVLGYATTVRTARIDERGATAERLRRRTQ